MTSINVFFTPDMCGPTEIDISETQAFSPPCYLPDMSCTYNINGDGRLYQMEFSNFEVEYEQRCDFDYVEVRVNGGTCI